MSRIALVALAACGGAAAPSAPRATPRSVPPAATRSDRPPVDPIAALAPSDDVSWLVPGRIQLELGGTAIEGPGGNRPIEVGLIDRQGNLVRAAVRLDQARFSLWTDRARLLALVQRDQRVNASAGADMPSSVQVILRAGARVRRLAKKGDWVQVRFVGAIEVEGWIPDAALGDSAARRDPIGRVPTGRRTLMVIPGAVIRSEPRWAARELAVMAHGYFLDTIQEIDQAWVEVAYADGEVSLHGFVSRRDPPGRVHRTQDPELAPPTVIPNAKVASGTCLYTRVGGDPAGYIVGDVDVELDDVGAGWWTLTIDTPWGPIAFGARGPTTTDLVACAPVGSVPPPAGRPPPTAP